MEELKAEHFECIKEENSEEESERQWERSGIVFETYYQSLLDRGLKEITAANRHDRVAFFVMDYLFVYDDALESILEVDGDTIRTYLGNWYIRKFWVLKLSDINASLAAISDFFKFLEKQGLVDKEQLGNIQEACRDKAWFQMRLETYFKADGEAFQRWIEEYNYDWC